MLQKVPQHFWSAQSLSVCCKLGTFVAVHCCALRGCCRRGEAREVLAKLLGAPVKTYVTRCALLELKALGAEFAGAVWGERWDLLAQRSPGRSDSAGPLTY